MTATKLLAAATATLLLSSLASPGFAQSPPSPGAASTAPAAPSTATFVPTLAVANLFEIESSRLAISRSQSDEIKSFARRMVTDHEAAGDKFRKALTDAGIPVPPEKLDARHQAIMDKLKAADGADFDRAYLEAQLSAHVEAVDLVGGYAKNGDTPRLKALAADILPSLEGHLTHVKKLRK